MEKVKSNIKPFIFKEFQINQQQEVMMVGTDGVLLGAWTTHDSVDSILDIGTGSGLLSLIMAQKYPEAKITAVDVDRKACELATANFNQSKWNANLSVIQSDISAFDPEAKFDLIISNPPFFNRKDLFDQSARQGMRNSIKLPHGELLRQVSLLMSDKGSFNLILPNLEGLRFIELAEMYNLFPNKMLEVLPKEDSPVKRRLIQLGKISNGKPEVNRLILRNQDDTYTEAFTALTNNLYLDQ